MHILKFGPVFAFIPALLFFLMPELSPEAGCEEMKSRVAVVPVSSEEEDNVFKSMNAAINDTILLTLKLLGKYEVLEDHGMTVFSNDEALSFAEQENIDNIIFGSVSRGESGETVITMSVWDRQRKSIVLSVTKRAESLLDIFDTADSIVVSVIEGFSGRHIGYGSIRLKPSGEDWGFRIELDGNLAGINTKEMGRVLIGEYNLSVSQQRIFGEHVLFSDTITVREGETTTVAFHIPVRTEEEAEYFDSLDREIIEHWHNPGRIDDIIDRIKEAWELIDGLNREGGYWNVQKQKYADWRVQIGARRSQLEGNGTRIVENRNTKILKADIINLLGRSAEVPVIYKPFGTGEKPLSEAKFFKMQESFLGDLEDNRIPRVVQGVIRVDGRRNDWIAVPSALLDEAGDSRTPGSDILSIKIARDDNRVYTLISFGDAALYTANHVWYQTYIVVATGGVNLHHHSWDGTWSANISEWFRGRNNSKELAEGTAARGRNFLEASFPLSTLVNRLGREQEYEIGGQGGYSGDQLDRVHQSAYLRIGE